MPKELIEINMFNAGTICNPSVTDIPLEAAADSFNIDPIAEDGKLKGIPIDTKLEDNIGHEVNVLVQNITDPAKHDLISYRKSNNIVYKAEDIYQAGTSTEASLGTLTATTDEVAVEVMEGATYLGQGTASNEKPQWIGRLDHGQWQTAANNSLVMEEDTLLPPNLYNEATTACSDGTHVFIADAGQHGQYNRNTESLKFASGEITKVRISDGKVIARSSQVLGSVNGICCSYDNKSIWALSSEKWTLSNYGSSVDVTNIHIIYKINIEDLRVEQTFTTNLNSNILASRAGTEDWETLTNDTDNTGNRWEDEDSLWDGASNRNYHGCFSDIIELYNSSSERKIWVCTSAGAVFNATLDLASSTIDFTDRTPIGLGYQYQTETYTENWMPPGGLLNTKGGFYKNDLSAWLFPEWYNGSLMQISDSNDHVGLYVKNGYNTETVKLDLDGGAGSSVMSIAKDTSCVFSIKEDNVSTSFINGTDTRAYYLNDSGLTSTTGVREISNMMYKAPYDVKKSAYQVIKTWSTSAMEWNLAEFDNPANGGTHGSAITTLIVEDDDTNQVPIRISDTVIVGVPSDVCVAVGDQNTGGSAAIRNVFRKFTKYTTADNWATSTGDDADIRTNFGEEIYLSQRHGNDGIASDEGLMMQIDANSSFHQANAGYFYRFSFVYDGFQESPLGAAKHIWSNGKQVQIPFTFHDDNFPKRVTAIRIYRATSISTTDRTIGGFYHFVGELDVTGANTAALTTASYTPCNN